MDKKRFTEWRNYISNLGSVLRDMQKETIIAVGVTPYPRIIPALFLDNYAIYCVKSTADIAVLRKHAKIFCLEERHPKIAARARATGYLIKSYAFQGFLKSWRQPLRLMFNQTTPKIITAVEEQKTPWLGNPPESFETLHFKGGFRDIVKKLDLPSLPDWRLPRGEFLQCSFQDVWGRWNAPAVVQRADFEVGGEFGTFFIRTEDEWRACYKILSDDERYTEITISPFIEGYAVSMLGCVTPRGVLTSPLQLQFVDVPEALHGNPPNGAFLGHDWSFCEWPLSAEESAQQTVETIGAYLGERGYKGIFGIDFMYDKKTQQVFPIECNPRLTGALPVYSLMAIANGVPPMELFHIAAHLGIDVDFNFDQVNEAFKKRTAIAHIALSPKGIFKMKLPLAVGIYTHKPEERELSYARSGAFLWDLENENEFLIIDSVPRVGDTVIQNVPRLFKLIFPRAIARSSAAVDGQTAALITQISTALRRNQDPEAPSGATHPKESLPET